MDIALQMGSLTSARGVIPAPHGPISVKVEQSVGKQLRLDIDLPREVRGRVILPREIAAGEVIIDGSTTLWMNAKPVILTELKGECLAVELPS